MRYFHEIELPNHMWIAEAAYWIAFGVVPEFALSQQSDDYSLEVRECVDTALDAEGHLFEFGLRLPEGFLARNFPEIEAKKYLESFDACGGRSPEKILNDWSDTRLRMAELVAGNPSDEELRAYVEDLTAKHLVELEAAKELRHLQVPIVVKLRQAQAKLFSTLIEGKISAKGVKLPLDDSIISNWSREEFPTEFSVIPSSSWDAQKIEWETSNLSDWESKYEAVTVECGAVFRLFPRPELPSIKIAAELFGETLTVCEGEESLPPMAFTTRKLGAPPKDARILLAAIFKHMDKQKLSGSLAPKKEAQIAEIMSFVHDRLGEELPRTTAQRYYQQWVEH